VSDTDLVPLGWDATRSQSFTFSDLVPGRVARLDGRYADVLTGAGALRCQTTNAGDAAVGDWVVVRLDGADSGEIRAVLPRSTALVRASASGRSEPQVLAANVDTVFVVASLTVAPRPAKVERMLAVVWDSGAVPVLVLTKADLAADVDDCLRRIGTATAGVDVHVVSAVTGLGVDGLRAYAAPGRTVALLGPSGVGKSTLVNCLLGADLLRTGEVRTDGKGRHTTSHRQLVRLPAGGVLVDTPGLRGLALWLDEDGLQRAFPDVEELTADCRFNDCAHRTEPGCAVLAAVETGRLAERRLESWRKLQRESEWQASRYDARLRSERARAWKSIARANRYSSRVRP
jgi:ribosome biogenesis GTPase